MSTDMQRLDSAWYLIQCKPRQDERAREHLNRQGFECFLPYQATPAGRLHSGKHRSQPLFPGYLFLHMPAQGNWSKLASTRGVNRVVGFCGTPCRINDAIISQLKYRCTQPPQPALFKAGDKVHISAGPLTDIDAIFLAMDGEQRVILLLRLLNEERAVKVPLAHLSQLQA